ncbi:ImmA/IrrE family metallo-endopeptidase [Frigoribacterium sp. PhB118]|uniref:ImmA/IrrE family metallo-endopeptidase n=1 Tax=Frigoribacterium sp. PhB118 TaxID=2485175 RepID=UPI000F47E0EE|nr:ImmA/IrrE family metallo-endopeptidase [Frigoribacterium sp. PhB118]ROS48781.1 uncharacterized protein DUF955 [Frigoribacterium sp. PhB118]
MSSSTELAIRARLLVPGRVEALVEILNGIDPNLEDRLQTDAIRAVSEWEGLSVILLDELPQTECSIAGVYFSDFEPAQIGIWTQVPKARQQFTALHELAHHLQFHDDALLEDFDSQSDQGVILEELTCDAFAARILLPPTMTTAILGAGTPMAEAVADLWRSSRASRAAVCVTVAQRLSSPGHVVLLDEDGKVQFSSSKGEPPLARGRDQSETAIVRALHESTRQTVTVRNQQFLYRDNIAGERLYAQATSLDGYTVVIAVAHNAPWENLSLSSQSAGPSAKWQNCGGCDHIFQVWGDRCPQCSAGYCPECRKCDCPSRVIDRLCTECFLLKPAQVFPLTGDVCLECVG